MSIGSYILAKKISLQSHDFIHTLQNSNGSKHTLAFAPDMAFFVLGFKDLLQICKVTNPKSADDLIINKHCEEDSHHWLWYLEDIEQLKALEVKNTHNICSGTAYARQVWSQENYRTRLHTYRIASLLINAANTQERLVIIDCLEAAFSVFITALNCTTEKSDLYERLRYFGKEHFMDEANHDQGSWLDETRAKKELNFFNSNLRSLVDLIFDGFQMLFTDWACVLHKIGVGINPISEEQNTHEQALA